MKYVFDKRLGCVAVYPEPYQNCLALPKAFFTFYRHGKRDDKTGWHVSRWHIFEAWVIALVLNSPCRFLLKRMTVNK